MDVVVDLTLATICFLSNCYPVLVGDNTTPGTYTLSRRIVQSEGYGGDVLQFRETKDTVYAIHRVWTLNPKQRREQRLKSDTVSDRKRVTAGCINVDPAVYDALVKIYPKATLTIKN